MKLLSLIFHLFHTWFKDLCAFIASRSKRLIITFPTIQGFILRAERLVYKRQLAHVTEEALLMPMLVLVGEVLGVGADLGLALLAAVGKQLLVAGDAVRLLVLEDVATASQRFIAVVTAEVISVKVLIHCSGILAVED